MTEQARAAYEALSAFDAAIAVELPRVSHLSYDSHEMCKHFAAQIRAALATHPTEPANHIERNLDMVEPVAAHGTQSTLHNAACDVPGLRNVPVEPTDAMANAGAQYAECGLPANAVFGYRAMIAAAPAQPAAGLVGLTDDEVVAAVTGPKSTGRWVDDVTRALAQKNTLPLRDGGER